MRTAEFTVFVQQLQIEALPGDLATTLGLVSCVSLLIQKEGRDTKKLKLQRLITDWVHSLCILPHCMT